MIFYGAANPPDIQLDGGTAIRDGQMAVGVSGLAPASVYYFSNVVSNGLGQSAPLSPIQYTTGP